MAAHRRWRLRAISYGNGAMHMTGVTNAVLASVAAVEFRAAAGVAPTYPLTGTPSTRSGTPANAFDNNPATSCDAVVAAGTHDFWAFDYGATPANWIEPVEVMIQARNAADAATRTPKLFAVEWSDDGVTWTVHCIRDVGGAWTAGQVRTAALAAEPVGTASSGFTMWRIRATVNGNGDGTGLGALRLANLEFRTTPGSAEAHNAIDPNGGFGNSAATSFAAGFDGDPATAYQSNTAITSTVNVHLGFNFGMANRRKVREVVLQAAATSQTLAPTDFYLEGCDDAQAWVTFGTYRTPKWATAGEVRTFGARTGESNDGLFSQLAIETAFVPSKNMDPRVSLLAVEVAYVKSTTPARRRPLFIAG